MTPSLMLIVIAKSVEERMAWESHNVPLLHGANYVGMVNHAAHSLAALANSAIDIYGAGQDVLGLIHADVFFDSPMYRMNGQAWTPDLKILTDTAASGAVCGIVGAANDAQRYYWGHSLEHEKLVSCLDGCSVFFPASSKLRFDEATFTGMHCHVEDLCLQAHERGIPVVVPPVKADHAGRSTFAPAWQVEYAKWRGVLNKKWEGKEFVTT